VLFSLFVGMKSMPSILGCFHFGFLGSICQPGLAVVAVWFTGTASLAAMLLVFAVCRRVGLHRRLPLWFFQKDAHHTVMVLVC
jgi:hypothetical protein